MNLHRRSFLSGETFAYDYVIDQDFDYFTGQVFQVRVLLDQRTAVVSGGKAGIQFFRLGLYRSDLSFQTFFPS